MEKMVAIRRCITCLTLIVALTILVSNAFAHSDLLRSRPADGERLQQIPKAIELTFKKELQTVSMNSVAVTDQNGRRVDKNIVTVSVDGKQMTSELEELGSGIYTVEWRALSADDHTIRGTFTFTVALLANNNSASIAVPAQPLNSEQMPMTHSMPMQESGTNWEQSAVRWLAYLAMMTLFGGFAFRLLVLKPSLEKAPVLSDEERSLGFGQGEDRFVRLTWLSLALLVAATLAGLVSQTSTVLDVAIPQAIAPSRLVQVLTETSYGPPWLLQIAAMLSLCVITFFIARQRRNDESEQKTLTGRSTLLRIGLGISALVFLPSSLTGHARAASGEYRFAIASDWLHLIAVGVWVGGLFHLALTVPKSITHLENVGRLCVVSRVIPFFSRIAVAATILIVLTGIYNSWIHMDSFSALWTTPYGRVLSLKIILFLPMLALGGINTFVLGPRAERIIEQSLSAEEPRLVDRSFYRSVRIEAAIGATVLLLAAFLAFLPPARQHEMPTNMSGPARKTDVDGIGGN